MVAAHPARSLQVHHSCLSVHPATMSSAVKVNLHFYFYYFLDFLICYCSKVSFTDDIVINKTFKKTFSGLDAVVTQLLGQLENSGPPPLPREQIAALPSEDMAVGHTALNTTCSVCWETFKLGALQYFTL